MAVGRVAPSILAAVVGPPLLLYMTLAYLLAVLLTLTIVPRMIAARKLNWYVSLARSGSVPKPSAKISLTTWLLMRF